MLVHLVQMQNLCHRITIILVITVACHRTQSLVFGDDLSVILDEINAAIDADDFSVAQEQLRKATVEARAIKDSDVIAELQETRKRITFLEKEAKLVEKYRTILQQDPGNTEASTALGTYYAMKDDWHSALPLLSQGKDETLKTSAMLDLQEPADYESQVDLGKRWFEAARVTRASQLRESIALRARLWFWRALEQIPDTSEQQTLQKLLERIELAPDKVIIYNTHNGPLNSRGTRMLNLTLLQDDTPVFQRRIQMIWKPDVSAPNVVRLTKRIPFNRIKLEVLEWEQLGGGLAELEVYQGKTNLALGALAAGDSSQLARCRPPSLTDGNLGSLKDQEGLWMLNNSTKGTVFVYLNRRQPPSVP